MAGNDVTRMIRDELAAFPVRYSLGHDGKHHYVEITSGDAKRKVYYPQGATGTSLLNVRAEIRRTLKQLGVEPRQRRGRIGTIGEALLQAAEAYTATEQENEMARNGKHCEAANGKRPTLSLNGGTPAEDQHNPAYALEPGEVVRFSRLFMAHAQVSELTGVATYDDDWSDERIVAILRNEKGRENIPLEAITHLRRTEFGPLQSEIEPPKPPTTEERLTTLEARMAAVEGAVLGPQHG